MINLLPETEKQFVKSEYSRRRLIIVLFFVFETAVVAALFLVPAFFIARYHLQGLKQTAQILQSNIAIANKQSLSETISLVNKKIATIEQEPSQKFTEIVDGIAAAKSDGIRITSFSLQQNASTANMTVKGNAKTRENLLDFSNKLKGNSAYKNVHLPISNFAKDSDIDFTLVITINA